ncbi:MAG: SDR family NAD(P)-dependent oxidoreductase [Proteobacteria bacterium]|nr:SDR family NAD(P)-dependent oxidoreductase [Pseudomonadota bacterium]
MRGKTIVITGAFGVLGRAAAKEAEARGATVAMLDIRVSKQSDAGPTLALAVDLGDLAATSAAMQSIRAKTGRIDALLNIAGGFVWQTVEEGDVAAWERMFALNTKTALTASKAAAPHLIESSGAIVNVGANAAVKAGAGMGAYAASKMGVMKLTESMAEELKGKVRVNAVLPSIIDTPQNRKDMPNADPNVWVKPSALAKAMLFLASDDASAITGALVPVTGQV